MVGFVYASMRNVRPLLVLVSLVLWAQASLPDTPAAHRFGEWLKVFNDGDRLQIQQYFEQHFPERAQMVDQTMYMRSQVGGFDLENIEQVTDTEITCLLKTRTVGREVRVSMRVEPDEPHNIADIRLTPAGRPSAQTAPVTRMDEAETVVALRVELEKRVASDQLSGAVLV